MSIEYTQHRQGEPPQVKKISLYPLQERMILWGFILALFTLVLQDWVVAASIFVLFACVGASWRSDMPPIIPACISYQWIGATSGYIFYLNNGYVAGTGYPDSLWYAVLLSLLGLSAVTFGLRAAMGYFRFQILKKTKDQPTPYGVRHLFFLTVISFAVQYAFDIAPKAIWFGGAQIVENLLALRFVPLFVLSVAVFERKKQYSYLVFAALWVIGPQLLTGFSRFKEILFVILIAALIRWRPWIATPQQKRQNRRTLIFSVIGAAVICYLGLVWTGGLKKQWRDEIWTDEVAASPIDRLFKFADISSNVVDEIDFGAAQEELVARLASGGLYFSYVTERVPAIVPYQEGRILGMAVTNATQPRFLFPDKANLGGDSWLVREFAGIYVAGDESETSVGLSYLAEFYIDYGVFGMIVLAFLWGALGGTAISIFARASPSREIFFALTIVTLTQYYMSFDGSFIKLLAGLLQRTIVLSVALALFGPVLHRWMSPGARKTSPRSY